MTQLLKKGDVLDDAYEIIEFISKGGFGAVYRARQLSMDRDVAVKLLIPGAQPDFQGLIQRFHNEVKAVRNLRHPNTVQIYDFHETNDEQLYFTMEYLEGRSLDDLIKEGEAISPRRTANILSQVLKSLAEAHSMGIVHRDIKPANIMLVDMYGEEDFVKVLDFGIAKAIQDGDVPDEDEGLTRTGFLVGTVRYMAPERIAGDPAGPYSDIYSLGLVGASLLIGQPILGNSSRLEAMQMQMGTKPLPIPESIKNSPFGPLLDRALAKSPADRFQSAEEMLEHLSSVPASAFSPDPVHITGEVPILESLGDTTSSDVAPTTVDSALQPRTNFTAEVEADQAEVSVPPPVIRARRPDTAPHPQGTQSTAASPSKARTLVIVGAVLLVVAGVLAWQLTGEEGDDLGEPPQDTDSVVTAPEQRPAEEQPRDNADEAFGAEPSQSEDPTQAQNEPPTPESNETEGDRSPEDSSEASNSAATPESDAAPERPKSNQQNPTSQSSSTRSTKETTTKKTTPTKKTPAKKTPAQKAPATKAPAKKTPVKQVEHESEDKSDDSDFIPVFGTDSDEPSEPATKSDEDDEIPVF
jgi:serine/threonine-protein kinase